MRPTFVFQTCYSIPHLDSLRLSYVTMRNITDMVKQDIPPWGVSAAKSYQEKAVSQYINILLLKECSFKSEPA